MSWDGMNEEHLPPLGLHGFGNFPLLPATGQHPPMVSDVSPRRWARTKSFPLGTVAPSMVPGRMNTLSRPAPEVERPDASLRGAGTGAKGSLRLKLKVLSHWLG